MSGAKGGHGEELFEVVDEKGRKLKLAPRSECHRKRLLHRSVHIFLFNKNGELFCQRRSLSKDLYPGKYTSSVSGHVSPAETPLHAAKRELREELGVKGVRLRKIAEFISEAPTERELATLYAGKYDGEMKLDENETIAKDSRFYSLKELEKIRGKMSPGFRDALEKYFSLR